jgi:hypothetical protein
MRVYSLAFALSGFGVVAAAQESLPLGQFLRDVDQSPVRFSGDLAYGFREDEYLLFYQGEAFPVLMDAGRELRSQVEERCRYDTVLSEGNVCRVAGEGTIEIRAGRIFVSLSSLDTFFE